VLLIEADGKALLRQAGITVPAATETSTTVTTLSGDGPWMVKSQVTVGGRYKAGGIAKCESLNAVNDALTRMFRDGVKSCPVRSCLIEQVVSGSERYLSVMVDPASYGLRVIYGVEGGIDIESSDSAKGLLCPPHPTAVGDALAELLQGEPVESRDAIIRVGRQLASLVVDRELALAEINPLFVAGTVCIAGDAKLVIDLNAIDRQDDLAALIKRRADVYVDADRKLSEGFDYVELDPRGEVGLITTGAGLSMMLVDEMIQRGMKPLNFCDIRTGQMRGSPARLMRVLEWINTGPGLKAILVNIFAGITDLSEFANLLAKALEGTPSLKVPVIARLVGRNAEAADRILHETHPDVFVTEDLNAALVRIETIAGPKP
jgi:succinyl-CoA synthetase beta subunit